MFSESPFASSYRLLTEAGLGATGRTFSALVQVPTVYWLLLGLDARTDQWAWTMLTNHGNTPEFRPVYL